MTALERRALDDQGEVLQPYVPRLLIEWVRDTPQATYRAVDGSLAFVDISGFTALTESLSRRGKIGAEVLRDTLDGVFRALLDEAYLWGAGLLKWGGDALLLLFDGAGHEQRAARAAWEMQRTIERVGRIRVGSGTVTLRMSIGIASGAIDFFTAGSVHRELLVVGPTATETAVIEGAADAGEIGISDTLALRLDPSCVGARQETGLLLAAPPDVDERPAPDVGRVSGTVIASCIPVAAREHVLLERSEPEHRTITAVFFDLMNTDVLLAELGPTGFAEALDERISSIQEAAARYEVPFNVTDVAKGSVKVLLTAGAPSSTGHDEEQALRLAREVLDRPGVVPLRAGINTGRVFTGDFGPPYRRAYAVLGDAINTAARVMARAEAGQILATEIVLERSRTTFETTPIDPFQAKGKTEPVRASLVGPIVGRREERIAETPFVGRERERAALRAVLDDVRAGNGWTVEIAGPSGIGKTRLIREVLAATPELRVFRATCEEYEASTPYHALHDPLRELLGLERGSTPADSERRLRAAAADADPELVPWVPLLGILLGLDLPPTPETKALDERFLRETLAEVTLRFLAASLAETPFALVVEDAQFLDDSSADLLHRVSKAADALPHALVVARTQPEGLWTEVEDEQLRFLAFDLLPLSEREAAEIVEITTDEQPFRPHEVEELARRSGGSPLFLVELLNVARAAGTDVLPDSVEAVVTADIDRLSASDRIALRYASVLGVTFEEALLAATFRDEIALGDALWERLRGLVDRDADGRLRFRNTLVHEAAYEGLPFRRRRELHGRVGLVLESRLGRRLGRRGGHAGRALLPRRELRASMALLAARRRPREGDLRERRRREPLRTSATRCEAVPRCDRPRGRGRGGVAGGRALPARRVRGGGRRVQDVTAPPVGRTGRRGTPPAQARAHSVAARPVPASAALAHARPPPRRGTRRAGRRPAESRPLRPYGRDQAAAGPSARGDRLVPADDRGRGALRCAGGPRTGALRPRLGVRDAGPVRRGRPLAACAHDLRGARRPRAPGGDPEQPRRHRLLPGTLGRGARALRAGRAGLGTVGRPLVGLLRRRQPSRGSPRPGETGRGGAADEGVAAHRESVRIRIANRGDGPLHRHAPDTPRPVRRGASAARRGAGGVRARGRAERGPRDRGQAGRAARLRAVGRRGTRPRAADARSLRELRGHLPARADTPARPRPRPAGAGPARRGECSADREPRERQTRRRGLRDRAHPRRAGRARPAGRRVSGDARAGAGRDLRAPRGGRHSRDPAPARSTGAPRRFRSLSLRGSSRPTDTAGRRR